MKRHKLLQVLVFGVLIFALVGCAPVAQAPAAEATQPAAEEAAAAPAGMEELVAAAQAEGELTVIALPRNWCNYGEVIDSFAAKYGIKVNEVDPKLAPATSSKPSGPTRRTRGPRRPT